MKRLSVLFAAAWLASGACAADTTTPAPTAASSEYLSIPFVDHGGIRDWRANDDRSMWIQARNGQWYYAEMFGPCFGLNFAERIGFVTEPSGSFDRFSSLIVDGQKCHIDTLRRSDPPSKLSRGDPTHPEAG
jgi:hypothetical protein